MADTQLSPIGTYVQPMNLQRDLLDEVDVAGGSGQVLTSLGPGLAPIWAAGSSVGGGSAYVHIQSVASTSWVIDHNQGAYLPVEVLDANFQEVEALVTHVTTNRTIVEFAIPVAGRALFG
jgi:hypothetical protein